MQTLGRKKEFIVINMLEEKNYTRTSLVMFLSCKYSIYIEKRRRAHDENKKKERELAL